MNIEEQYPTIVSEIMKYIDKVKREDTKHELALIDIILDASHKLNIDVEIIGDAIHSDVYFRDFIESDCKMRNIIRNKKEEIPEMEEW